MWFNQPLNCKQFWLAYLVVVVLGVCAFVLSAALHGADAEPYHTGLILIFVLLHLRLIYLRAVDVGYRKPGWLAVACVVPLLGTILFLVVGFQRSGAERLPVPA